MEWIKYSLVYTADSKIRFEIESDGRFDSRFDSNAKKRFAGPYYIYIAVNRRLAICKLSSSDYSMTATDRMEFSDITARYVLFLWCLSICLCVCLSV